MTNMAVLFDMDGTVISSRKAAVDAAVQGLKQFFDVRNESPVIPDEEEIVSRIGLPSEEYFRSLLPPSHRDLAKQLKSIVQEIEIERIQNNSVEFYGSMSQVLNTLFDRGAMLGLVTNAGKEYFEANCKALSLDDYFHSLYCVDETESGEKQELVMRVLQEFNYSKPVMVGDRMYDLEAAQAHDVPFIGCAWGYGSDEELNEAEAIVRAPRELPEAIGRVTGRGV